MAQLTFYHRITIPLHHHGDCVLAGLTPDGTIFAQEIYGEDDSLVQHQINENGVFVVSVDENNPKTKVSPIDLLSQSNNAILSPKLPHDHVLNFTGLRQRGLREADRVLEWVQPLTIQQKMRVIEHLHLPVPPMLLLGIAGSTILSQAQVQADQHILTRRLRIAYALPQPQTDENGIPYDYDTIALHLLHPFDAATEATPPLEEILAGFGGIALQRPQDCLYQQGKLYLADASNAHALSRIVIWDHLNADT